jgi:hypothetical protein
MKLTSTDVVSHIKITSAGLTALLVTVVGQVIAFVPSLASDQQILISAGSTAIAAVFLVANAVHALAGSKAPAALLGEPLELKPMLGTFTPPAPVTVNVHGGAAERYVSGPHAGSTIAPAPPPSPPAVPPAA